MRFSFVFTLCAYIHTGQFAFYFPKIFQHYSTNLCALFSRHPYLEHNFANSIFPVCTFNASPQSVCLEHVDSANFAGGGCPISSSGSYDPTLGGHLILFDWKVYIEFPPGSTIIIPSSSLAHGNTPVQPGETRVSFTQYCAGGLFRWVGCGFRSLKSCSNRFQARMRAGAVNRWKAALFRFSKVDELHKDCINVFNL